MRFWNAWDSDSSFARAPRTSHHAWHSGHWVITPAALIRILKEHVMWINTPSARLAIGARRALRLDAAHGTTLRAVQGTLWITIDHDSRDIVLDPGEAFVVDSNQPLVVLALGSDCATLDLKSVAPSPAAKPHPVRSWLGLRRREPVAQMHRLRGATA
jgi:DUF2917 family protein